MGRKRALRVRMPVPRHTLRRPETGTFGRGAIADHGHGEYRMNLPRFFRLAMVALVPAAAISLGLGAAGPGTMGIGTARAQSPPATPPAASTPATPPPNPSPNPSQSPSSSPSPAAEAPATPPPAPGPVQTADPFGEHIELTPKTVVIVKGSANWDAA